MQRCNGEVDESRHAELRRPGGVLAELPFFSLLRFSPLQRIWRWQKVDTPIGLGFRLGLQGFIGDS